MFEIVARELRAKLLGRRRGQAGLRGDTPSHAQQHSTAGVEGAGGSGGPGCGGRGRQRGLADTTQHRRHRRCGGRRRDRRARAGFEIDTSEPQARVWRSRGRAAAHRHTQRPGPKAAQRSAQNTSVATQRQHAAPTASGRASAHGRTKQPGPTAPGTPAAPQAPPGPGQTALTLRRRVPGVPCS